MFIDDWGDAPFSDVDQYTFVCETEPEEPTREGGIIAIKDSERKRYEPIPFGWYTSLQDTNNWERLWPAAIGDIQIIEDEALAKAVDISAEVRSDVAVSLQRCLAALEPVEIEHTVPFGIAVEVVKVHQRLTEEDAVRFVRDQTSVQTSKVHKGQDELADIMSPDVCEEIARLDRSTNSAQFPVVTSRDE